MADILTFTGTPNAVYSPPAGWTNRGDGFRIGPDGASICGGSIGTYSQLVSDTAAGLIYESIVTCDRIASGSNDSIASTFINSSRTGFVVEVGSLAGGTLYCRKQVGGANGADIVTPITGVGEPLGINTIRIKWNLSTGDFEAYYNGALIASANYIDTTSGMNAGGAIYRDGASINITITELESGAASSTSIDSITTDGNPGLVVGEDFVITTTGLSGSALSITVGTVATPAAIVSTSSISGNGNMPYWVDGQYYPFAGTVQVTATDVTMNSAVDSFSLALPADQVDVVFNSVETSNNTYIGNKLLAIGKPLANGDIGYYPPAGPLVIGTNSSVSSAIGATTFVLWIHKVSGILERYDVVINDAGEITDVTGITSRGITSRAVTSRVVTSRGI